MLIARRPYRFPFDRVAVALLLACRACVGADEKPLKELKPEPYYSRVLVQLAKKFPAEHVTRAPLDDAMSSRIWTNYLAELDFERSYFLASDIDKLRASECQLDDQIKEGNLAFAYDVFHLYRQRVHERFASVQQILDKGFDLNVDETYHWQRKDAPWPKDAADMDELWRKRIKNEYVREVLAAEAIKKKAASTNAVASATNAPPAAATNAPAIKPPSPRDLILDRYRQIVTMIDDCDSEWVLDKFLAAFTHAYDPHSDYMSPSGVEDFEIEMKLSLVGIGALLRPEDGAAKVLRLVPGGPADRDKRDIRLRPGDKIVAVAQGDGPSVDILHWPLHKVVDLIRGEKGSRVVLTVVPAADSTGSTTRKVDLIRDEVKLEEQAASASTREIKGDDGVARKLGVIRLPGFYANMKATSKEDPEYKSAMDDVAHLLTQLSTQKVDGVILDLRNNGGGSLLEAITMSGLFLPPGPIVQVRERWRTRVLQDREPHIAYAGPLEILVNRLSASASEIVTAALQDYGRAVIVGDSKTHGKGSVQSLVDLDSDPKLGSAKITTATYYRISGGSTQLKGVASDIVLPSPFEYMELGEDSLPNALPWSQISAADYKPVADLAPIIAQLRAKSEKRQADNPRFVAYKKLLTRIEAMQKMADLPLNIEARRQLAKTEEEIIKLQDELAPDNADATGDKSKVADPVLDEALRILADQVTLQTATPPSASRLPTQPEPPKTAQTLVDWLLEKL